MTIPESRVRILELAARNGKLSELGPEDSAELDWCTKIVSLIAIHPSGITSLTNGGVHALELHYRSLAAKQPDGNTGPTKTGGKRKGRTRKGETDKDMLVIAALAKHHDYGSGGNVGNPEPAGVNQLAKDYGLTTAAISRFFGKQSTTGHKGYKVACHDGSIGLKLALWQNEPHDRLAKLRLGEDKCKDSE